MIRRACELQAAASNRCMHPACHSNVSRGALPLKATEETWEASPAQHNWSTWQSAYRARVPHLEKHLESSHCSARGASRHAAARPRAACAPQRRRVARAPPGRSGGSGHRHAAAAHGLAHEAPLDALAGGDAREGVLEALGAEAVLAADQLCTEDQLGVVQGEVLVN